MKDSLGEATGNTISRQRPFRAYKGSDPYVFVCYAHEDASLVYPEMLRLKDDGFNIWYDEGIAPGHTWRDEVARALTQCEVFLYFITPRSAASSNCLKELNLCLSKRRKILSVHLEKTELSAGLELGLSDVQAIIRRDHSEQDYRKRLSDGLRFLIHDKRQPGVARQRQLVSNCEVERHGFVIGDYWIEPDTNEIGGVRIDARAMAVLIALVDAAPAALSSEHLLHRVWPDRAVGVNVVHRAIALLRKSLGDKARAPVHLQCVRRRGYRLTSNLKRRAARHESNRIDVAIVPVPQGADRATRELAASLTRYISWNGGPFRAIHVKSYDQDVGDQAIDYLVEIASQEPGDLLRVAWQVQRVHTAEIVWANHHCAEESQGRNGVAEMIGEGVLGAITDHESRRIARISADDLTYAQLILKAARPNGWNSLRIAERYALLARAIELEPETALAYAVLADLLLWKLNIGVARHSTERDASIARIAAEQAFELDPDDPYVLSSVGQTYCHMGQYEEGLSLLRRAVALAPAIRAKSALATSLCFAGQPDEAIRLFTEMLATMLAGSTFRCVYGRLAIALTQAGRLTEALAYSKQYVIHAPTDGSGWVVHANLLGQVGRIEDGWRAFAEAQRLVPTLGIEQAIAHTEATYARSSEQQERLTAGLHRLCRAVSGRNLRLTAA